MTDMLCWPCLQVCNEQTRLSLLKIPYTYTICEPEKACLDKYERCHAAIQSQQNQANANLKNRLKSFTQQPVGASSSRQQRASFKKNMKRSPSAAVVCEDDEAALKTNMKIPKCADIVGFCTDKTNGQHARKYCPKTCGVCSTAVSTKSCRDPHRTDPESWE